MCRQHKQTSVGGIVVVISESDKITLRIAYHDQLSDSSMNL